MKQYLENLRAKPDRTKRQIAFYSSLGISLVILMFWLVSFSISTRSIAAQDSAKIESPLASITANVSDAWGSLAGIFGGKKYSSAGTLQVLPGNR